MDWRVNKDLQSRRVMPSQVFLLLFDYLFIYLCMPFMIYFDENLKYFRIINERYGLYMDILPFGHASQHISSFVDESGKRAEASARFPHKEPPFVRQHS